MPPSTLAWVLGSEAFWDQFDLKSSGMQSAYRGMQRHAEEFRSKKGGTFQAELSMFRSFFRNRRACRNNSFKNYSYITEKGWPNTTWR